MTKKYLFLFVLVLISFCIAAIYTYNTYYLLYYTPSDMTGNILTVDRYGGIILLKLRDYKIRKEIINEGNSEIIYSHPVFFGKYNVLFERTNVMEMDCLLYNYNISDNTRTIVGKYDKNDLYPSISHDLKLMAIYRRNRASNLNDEGVIEVREISSNKLIKSSKIKSAPAKSAWGMNDRTLFTTAIINNVSWIVKNYIENNKIDTICYGSHPSISNSKDLLAYIDSGSIVICDTLGREKHKLRSNNILVKTLSETPLAWSPNDRYIVYCGEGILSKMYPTYNLYAINVANNKIYTLLKNIDIDCDWQ